MTLEVMREALMWCTIINAGMLLVWWVMFMVARGWIWRAHGRWFKLSEETFCAIHYGGMAFYKMLIFMFCLVPWVALMIVGDG